MDAKNYFVCGKPGSEGKFPSLVMYPDLQIPVRFEKFSDMVRWSKTLGYPVEIYRLQFVATTFVTGGIRLEDYALDAVIPDDEEIDLVTESFYSTVD